MQLEFPNQFFSLNGQIETFVSAAESPFLFGAECRLKLAVSMLLWKRDEIV